MKIDVSPGEVADRLTILEIKLERITEPGKRQALEREYETLLPHRAQFRGPQSDGRCGNSRASTPPSGKSRHTREHERRGDFGPAFVELARSVYVTNDRRAAVKQRINEHLGSAFAEVKSYSSYRTPAASPTNRGE